MTNDPLLSYAEIAQHTGVGVRTLRNYRAGNATSVPLPEPDDLTFPDRPRWKRSSIDAWMASRRGQGWRKGG
jgi:predicted DNA-binding transcriptional regulator AlpA